MEKQKKEIKWFEPLEEQKHENVGVADKVKKYSKAPAKKKGSAVLHLERFTAELEEWLSNIAVEMNIEGRPDIAYQALRGVLQAIRNRAIPEEVFNLSAQFPLLIRGLYFEGYNLKNKPEKYDADEFLKIIENSFGGNASIEPETALKAVLKVLYDHISVGELEDIYHGMPKDIRQLWKECLRS